MSKHNFGLSEVGADGKARLLDALANCTDPLQAIEEFQERNGIVLPSLKPMLQLLDLHNIRRLDFHTAVLEELKEKLISKINELSQLQGEERDKKLKSLFQASFPAINIKQLRPVVMCIMKNVSDIDDKSLQTLVSNKELYAECETEVKRQIWRDNQSLFGDEVSPLLSQYIDEKAEVLFDHKNLTNLFFSPSPKMRRQGKVVQKLAHMIGTNVKLYDMVLQFLRTLFLRTKNPHYCTLRAELLMALHDLEVQDIISVDPCHKFTWCLDACVREKNVDVKRSRELQGFLDNIQRGQEEVLGDLSMILCDPYAINFLATSAMKIMLHIMNAEGLPRENTVLILLLRMLALGLSAWTMINSQEFVEPKPKPDIIIRFLPSLIYLMVDDSVRHLSSRLPLDERESAITLIDHTGPPPDAVVTFVQQSSVASTLAMYYALHCARNKDKTGLMRIMGVLANAEGGRAFQDPFLHSLVALLIPMADEFSGEDFCTVIFDEFFTTTGKENVCRHMLKLMWYIHAKLPALRTETLIKLIEAGTKDAKDPNVQKLFLSFMETVQAHQGDQSNQVAAEDIDSPLMSVPTPAPL